MRNSCAMLIDDDDNDWCPLCVAFEKLNFERLTRCWWPQTYTRSHNRTTQNDMYWYTYMHNDVDHNGTRHRSERPLDMLDDRLDICARTHSPDMFTSSICTEPLISSKQINSAYLWKIFPPQQMLFGGIFFLFDCCLFLLCVVSALIPMLLRCRCRYCHRWFWLIIMHIRIIIYTIVAVRLMWSRCSRHLCTVNTERTREICLSLLYWFNSMGLNLTTNNIQCTRPTHVRSLSMCVFVTLTNLTAIRAASTA